MLNIDKLSEFINQKLAVGITIIDLDEEIVSLFGVSQNAVDEFNKKFSGKYTPELTDILIKAGTEKLLSEEATTIMAYNSYGSDFSSLVESSIFGDGSLIKNSNTQRYILSERMICIGNALEQLSLISDELNRIKKDSGPSDLMKVDNLWWWK